MTASQPRRRVSHRRIAEAIADELRARILVADEGYRLPTQDQLVEELGVSYPSVREALRILETEGLVTVRRGNVGGAEVHRPDESSAAYHVGLALQAGRVTLGDLAAGLQLLEPLCAVECARRDDRAETVVPALEANIAASAALADDGIAFTHTAREFHDLLVAHTPNATVRHMVGSLTSLWTAQEEAWAAALAPAGEYPEDTDAVIRTHRRLLTEIAAGRATSVERLARAHLAATQALVLERFGDGKVVAVSARDRAPASARGWRH
jgi:GntR family transcriptional repressor for pyruvate dehydrogenase complex